MARRSDYPTDNELPGMWTNADFTGGATDCEPEAPARRERMTTRPSDMPLTLEYRVEIEAYGTYAWIIGAWGPLEEDDLSLLNQRVFGLKDHLFTEPGIYLVTPDPMTFQITTKDVKRIDVQKGEKE